MEFFNYWEKNNYKKTVNKKPVIKKQPKIFNFDINKCRKNELYYSKYDFPSFIVMDKVEPYDKNKSLTTGKYRKKKKKTQALIYKKSRKNTFKNACGLMAENRHTHPRI